MTTEEKLEKKKKKNLSLLEKQLNFQALKYKRFAALLIRRQSQALRHHQVIEESTRKVFSQCFQMFHLMKTSKAARSRISSILGSLRKNKWKTFLDKLSSLEDQSTLPILLLQILVQESILKEKACQHYWTPAFKTESEKWSLPIEIGSAGSALNLLKVSSTKQAEKLPSLVLKTKKLMNPKNSQMTSLQLLPSSVADKWEGEVIKAEKVAKQRTIKLKIYPTKQQKTILNETFSVYNYVYNKTNALIKDKSFSCKGWYNLRNHLVSENTKLWSEDYRVNTSAKSLFDKVLELIDKTQELTQLELAEIEVFTMLKASISNENKTIPFRKNPEVKEFEIKTHKNVRADAVKTCCEMYKSAMSNLEAGNIKYYNISYKKKNSPSKCFGGIAPDTIKLQNQSVRMMSGKLGEEDCEFKISKKNYDKYVSKEIDGECKVLYKKGNYFFCMTLEVEPKNSHKTKKICGIDPGLRSLFTIYDKENITELAQNRQYFKALNRKIRILKALRTGPGSLKRIKKRHFNKIEKKKIDYTDSLHWSCISFLLKNYDTILYGDIKSHDIVKKGFNKSNNQEFNDLKFYVFKQRLVYKAKLAKKLVREVNEFNTTKCCSNCGNLNNNVGASEIYNCEKCKLTCGRDANAAKNILLKGILC